MLLSLETVAIALVSGSVCGFSRCWERFLLLSSLGVFVGALNAGSGSRQLSLEAVVGGLRRKQSLVVFVGSGLRCSL